MSLPVIQLDLDRIRWVKTDNPRDGSSDVVRMAELAQADPLLFPPLVVALMSSGEYLGIDGYARHAVARQLGLKKIAAVVDEMPSDVRDRAFDLNSQHGWMLSIRERKRHAAYLKDKYPHLSDREIARRCRLSPTTVGSVVQNGQAEPPILDLRGDLAKATVRFCNSFTNLQTRINQTFLINPNRPKSVAAVLIEHGSENREWTNAIKTQCLEIAVFMRDVASELK